MTQSPFHRWLGEDNDKCLPMLDQTGIALILAEVDGRVRAWLGDGPNPLMTALDLEQIQVTDYSCLGGVSATQAAAIQGFHEQAPVRPDEMLFLGLRSLFQFTWPEPRSENDIRFAAAFDLVLNKVLKARVGELSSKFSAEEGLLPYWGRLAFLRVMIGLPEENVERFGLRHVAVSLVKKSKFNATTWAFDDGPVITLNYALEPILKQLNRYLLHYHSTRDMEGPARLHRAWRGIVPIVLHFWSDVVATRIVGSTTTLYGEDLAVMLHRLTSNQVDFIVSHELGHVVLDHPRKLKKARAAGQDVTTLRHEFEFGADAFALGLIRSKLMSRVKDRIGDDIPPDQHADLASNLVFELHEYQRSLGATLLLFMYMDFIQRAGELVRNRLGHQVRFAERMDTHPDASERLTRLKLMNAGERLYTSPLERYGRTFFDSVLAYASALDNSDLLESVS